MARRFLPFVLLLLVLGPAALVAQAGEPPGHTARKPFPVVFSYFDGFVELPHGETPGKLGPRGCAWRMYDPATGTDSLVLTWPTVPEEVRWSDNFRRVSFCHGGRLYAAAWRIGAVPRVVAQLPPGLTICGVWQDAGTKQWRLDASTLWREEPDGPTSMDRTYIIGLYGLNPKRGRWEILQADTTDRYPKGCDCAEFYFGEARAHSSTGLEDMLAWAVYSPPIVDRLPGQRPAVDDSVRLHPLFADPSRALRFRTIPGRPEPVLPPVYYVHRKTGAEHVVYEASAAGPRRLAARQLGGYVLIGEEYTGNGARLIEAATGTTLKRFPRTSTAVVGIPQDGK